MPARDGNVSGTTRRMLVRAAWIGWLAASVLGAAAAGPTTAPGGADLDARADALAGKVLADPLNAAARDDLERLRRTQCRRDLAAYRALAQGLRAYLAVGPDLAAPALRRAAASARAASLTRSLARPLGKILADLAPAESPAPGKRKACDKCADTGQTDCVAHRCYASGRVPCAQCKGTGVLRVEGPMLKVPVYRVCQDCGGTGVVRCQACAGTGAVRCTACKGQPEANWSQRHLAPAEVRQIRQVICKARRLARGEVDLYTAGALTCAPK